MGGVCHVGVMEDRPEKGHWDFVWFWWWVSSSLVGIVCCSSSPVRSSLSPLSSF